jgi:Ca-activated chloride channel family protein
MQTYGKGTEMSSLRVFVPLTLLAVLGFGLSSGVAAGEPGQTATVPTMIVLDASGSMNGTDAPGSRIEAARSAVTNLVNGLPSTARVGLEVYGTGTGNAPSDKAAGCKDIKTLVPVGTLDKASFITTVSQIKASGYTPIGNALRAAAAALPKEGSRAIVLVSDGIDTCSPPPPCDVAKELAAQGVDLTIHTVGFKVDAAAKKQLECIASSTKGTYSEARDSAQLEQAIRVKVDYAITGYSVQGTRVSGGSTAADPAAPTLAPGQYVDTYPEGQTGTSLSGTKKFYRIEVPQGYRARVSATLIPPASGKAGRADNYSSVAIDIRRTGGGSGCGSDSDYGSARVTAAMPATAEAVTKDCSGPLIVEVTRAGKRAATMPATVELLVRFEPPADSTLQPPAETVDAPETPRHSTPADLTAGNSFNNAPEISSGQTYRATIVSGEVQYVKIPVAWGQQVAFAVDPVARTGSDASGVAVVAEVYDPMRKSLWPVGEYGTWYGGNKISASSTLGSGTTHPVRYLDDTYNIDGFYYLAVAMSKQESGSAYRTTYVVTMITTGKAEQGPVYTTASPAATGTTTPTGAATASAPLPNASETPSASTSGMPPLGFVAIGGGLAVAALVIGGGVWLMRRRG